MSSEYGRIELGLFGEICPVTVENFKSLSTVENIVDRADSEMEKPSYQGSVFHRIVPNFIIQGGDITSGNGVTDMSIGYDIPKEYNDLVFDKPFLLAMANSPSDSDSVHGTQFFLTTVKARWLDDSHVIFGTLLKGHGLIDSISNVGTQSGKPWCEVKIVACGELSL